MPEPGAVRRTLQTVREFSANAGAAIRNAPESPSNEKSVLAFNILILPMLACDVATICA
jgi:hypothetical protein